MNKRIHTSVRLLVAASLLAALPVAAQAPPQPESAKKDAALVRLNRAPISNDVLRVHIPKPVKATLTNGVRVLILEDHRFPTVTTELVIRGAGPLYDPAAAPGTASLMVQLMRQGTATRNSRQLAEDIDALGANIGGSATPGSPELSLTASGLSDNFDQWFGIAADILLHPSFPADELDQLKQRTLVQLRQQRTNPAFLAQERFAKALYGDGHPAAVLAPTVASVGAATPQALASFYHERVVPQNAILAIAGDVKPAEVTAKLNKWLAEWKKTELKVTIPSVPEAQTSTKLFVVDRPGSVQTNLRLGNLAIDRRDPDYVPLQVMNDVLGGSAAARLFMNLREDKGYTYGAYSQVQAQQYRGAIVANSEVRTDVTQGAVTEFFNEFHRIVEVPVTAEELQKAKRSMVAQFALSMERPSSMLNFAVTSERYGFADDYWDKYPDQIMAVTAGDVARVAKKYLNPAAVQIVAVGDATKVKPMLEKWGTVTLFAADGSPAKTAAGQ
jgi:predicted Zn-dependent peptidase